MENKNTQKIEDATSIVNNLLQRNEVSSNLDEILYKLNTENEVRDSGRDR